MTWLRRLAVALLCSAIGCAVKRPPAAEPQPAERPFIITFWCGPPMTEFTDARAEEIAAAGFNIVGPQCEGGRAREDQLRALDVAQRHGLRLWIIDNRFGKDAPKQAGWEETLDAAVADYRSHPALDGYFVTDEPGTTDFDAVAKVVARLHEVDPSRMAYVNLFADYVGDEELGTEDYPDYVERFATTVRPELLSYDYYPFLEETDRPGFFRNLTTIRELSTRHNLPFMLIVQAMPHWFYRDPTAAELAWQVFHAVAYGARGISYFAYWTPVNVAGADTLNFHYGLIEGGRPTRHYFEALHLNHVVRAITDELAPFRWFAVADSTGEIGLPFPIGPIDGIEGGTVTAGLFGDTAGRLAVLLVNRDTKYGTRAAIRVRADAHLPELFDSQHRTWLSATSPVVDLAPGDARLLRWR